MCFLAGMELSFGQKLTMVREACDLTQTEVAKRSGIAQGRISDWEKGKGRIFADQAKALADAMGVSADTILDLSEDTGVSLPRGDLERELWKVVRTIGPENAYRLLTGRVFKIVGVRERLVDAGDESEPAVE